MAIVFWKSHRLLTLLNRCLCLNGTAAPPPPFLPKMVRSLGGSVNGPDPNITDCNVTQYLGCGRLQNIRQLTHWPWRSYSSSRLSRSIRRLDHNRS